MARDGSTTRGPASALLVLGAALVGCGAGDEPIDRSETAEGLRGLELVEPVEIPEFTLPDTEGEPYAFRSETAGRLALLFFGYANCPDICPVQMAILDAALEDLPYAERRQVSVVVVTTDPERDTPRALRAWLDRFDEGFVGLRPATFDDANALLATMDLPASIVEAPAGAEGRDMGGGAGEADGYTVGHATPIFAITGDGRARAMYPSGVRQADWRHDLPLLLAWNAEAMAGGTPGGASAGG